MKKIFRKKIFAFFLSALLVLALSLPVFADMGPKPSVTLKLYYTPGQRYAVTLLGNTALNGPWTAPADYRERMGSREAWEAFRNYPAPEGYYFLGYFQEYPGTADEEFVWGYYPPNKFYVLLYNIETGTFYRSEEPVERYAFSSEWQVLLDSQDGLRVYHNRNDSDILSSFAARVLITLILELTWGILLFGLRGPAQRNLIGQGQPCHADHPEPRAVLRHALSRADVGQFPLFCTGGAGVLRGSLCLQPVSALAGGQKASPHLLCADRQSPFLRHRAGIEHPLHQHTDPADRACLSGAVVRRAVALSKAAESAKCTIKRKIFVKNQSCCAPGNPL